jgi:tetratricopeptide (TPR) repeat protein
VNNAGTCYAALGQYDEALRWYKRRGRLNPNAFGVANAASVYALLGDVERSRRLFAEELDPDLLGRTTLAVYEILIELHAGDADAAVERADAAPPELLDNLNLLTYRAAAYTMGGEFERARQSAERVLELSPGTSLGIYYNIKTFRGFAALETGDPVGGRAILEERAADIRTQLDAGADQPSFFWELAAISAALGDPEEAVRLATP